MKMKKFALSLVAVAACAGAFRAYESYQQSGESNALLAENVEALSNLEPQSVGTILKYVWQGLQYFSVLYTVHQGCEEILSQKQIGYLAWSAEYAYVKNKTVTYVNGVQTIEYKYGHRKKCTYYEGNRQGNCSPEGTIVTID